MLSVLHSQCHAAGALATLGATASVGMVLTPQSRNILSPASEELNLGPVYVHD